MTLKRLLLGTTDVVMLFTYSILREASATAMTQEVPRQIECISSGDPLNVTLLGSEWNSEAGGLSTFNRELAIHLSQHPEVEVSLLVPEGHCTDGDKREAQSFGITVVDANKRIGFEPLDWLSFPPGDLKIDVVVGHGMKLGRQGQVIRDRSATTQWIQVVHTAPEELSRFKRYPKPIAKGGKKHEVEVGLCKLANLVVPVGPRLEEVYSAYLQLRKKDLGVFAVTPGLFDREFGDLEQSPNENAEFKVLLCGRGDDEDFELKGYDVAAKAFADHRLKTKRYQLTFVGAPEEKVDDVREKLLQYGIDIYQLTVRKFDSSRESMKYLFCEVDLVIMPSKSEGFGLISLEALSAGLPILVSSRSGFARAIENLPFGRSFIVDVDNPAHWAEKIEDVRLNHRACLEGIKELRAWYDKKYSWKHQCEALVERMRKLVHGMLCKWLARTLFQVT